MRSRGSTTVEADVPIRTAADVYRRLSDEGLMFRKDGTGRDDALWVDLVEALGLPKKTDNLPKALERKGTSVEEFVRSFLSLAKPFAMMMTEICAFMERNKATSSYHALSISYRFSDEDKAVEFNLSHFREFWRTYCTLVERSVVGLWSTYDVRDFANDLKEHIDNFELSEAEHEPRIEWNVGDELPEAFVQYSGLRATASVVRGLYLAVKHAQEEDIEGRVDELWFVPDEEGTDEKQMSTVEAILRTAEIGRPRRPSPEELEKARSLVERSHRYISDIYAAVLTGSEPIRPMPGAYEYGRPNSLEAILSRYEDLPTYERQRESIVEQLESMLRLPVWRYRWQLYQVWVGLTALGSFQAAGINMDVHVPESRLELYEYHPAQLADFTGCRDSPSFWSELQTALPKQVGSSRSIKPDYRVARSPVSNPASTLLVIEAKQRLFVSKAQLELLCERYRAGCPNGRVLVVNYDDLPTIDKKLARNASLVGEYRPDNGVAKNEVRRILHEIASDLLREQEERINHEQQAMAEMAERAAKKISGLEFLGGFERKHKDERVGAIVLDLRSEERCLFPGGPSVRSHVVQYLRANPLAQVWLAGVAREPVLAFQFDFGGDLSVSDSERCECDLPKLLSELKDTVEGAVVVFGYSSALPNVPWSGDIITEGYSG